MTGTVLLSTVSTLTRRNSPPLFGVGLIDSIPAEVISRGGRAAESPIPRDQGASSRLERRECRAFWLEVANSVAQGIRRIRLRHGARPGGSHASPSRPPHEFTSKENGLDLNQDECDALTSYVSRLPAPIERVSRARRDLYESAAGRKLFDKVGCTACHMHKLGTVEGIYSDLLLHDMGTDLADSGSYYGSIESPSAEGAKSQEWRTPRCGAAATRARISTTAGPTRWRKPLHRTAGRVKRRPRCIFSLI